MELSCSYGEVLLCISCLELEQEPDGSDAWEHYDIEEQGLELELSCSDYEEPKYYIHY